MTRRRPDTAKVLILIDSLDIGGAQRLLEIQVAAMVGMVRLTVVNLGRPTHLSDSLRALGAEVTDLGMRRLLDLAGVRRLLQVVRRTDPDVLHVHLIHATLLGALAAARCRVPLVVTLHNELPNTGGLGNRIKNMLEAWILARRARVAIACGPRVATAQRHRVGRTPLVTVSNRVRAAALPDAATRAAARQAAGIDAEDVVLLGAGRLVEQKGFDILLDALARALPSTPRLLVLIAGEGEDRARLKAQAAGLGIAERLRLLGPVSDVERWMEIADVFVLPSRYEGLPLVLLEALARSLPVIASAVGDVPSVLGDGQQRLVPPEDRQALARALAEVAADPAARARMAQAASAAARPFTDTAGFAAELQAVYAQALGEGDPR